MTTVAAARHTHPPRAPMALLAQGVPLSLLLDLLGGPRSEDILREEAVRIPVQWIPQR